MKNRTLNTAKTLNVIIHSNLELINQKEKFV